MDNHTNDKPYTLPAAATLAERLMARAWDDDVSDPDRLLFEQAADAINELMARLVRLAAAGERCEARRLSR